MPLTFPRGARVLELGCAEADWLTPMKACRPDLVLTGIDVRSPKRDVPAEFIKGDALTYPLEAGAYDAIIGISSIEHFGLGHYGDPADADGDSAIMRRVVGLLSPGGWAYLDVPFAPDGYHQLGTKCRIYDADSLQRRLIVPGLREVWRGYYAHDGKPVSEPEAYRGGKGFGYVALQLQKV